MIAHQESITASAVLKAQTNRKGLCGPSQLTSEKLKILISTPTISTIRNLPLTAAFNQRNKFQFIQFAPFFVMLDPFTEDESAMRQLMTCDDFRRIALSLPETAESEHMNHPDFRVRGKIFATLPYPEQDLGMVKLKVAQQAHFMHHYPKVFVPVKGGWGRKGATIVRLEAAEEDVVRQALVTAWRNTAPRALIESVDDLD
jgi:hypothetical protein